MGIPEGQEFQEEERAVAKAPGSEKLGKFEK